MSHFLTFSTLMFPLFTKLLGYFKNSTYEAKLIYL